jgi:hypothetical protein
MITRIVRKTGSEQLAKSIKFYSISQIFGHSAVPLPRARARICGKEIKLKWRTERFNFYRFLRTKP